MNSAEKMEVKPIAEAVSNNTVELKVASKNKVEVAPVTVCKDGVCTLNWKPRRPGTAA